MVSGALGLGDARPHGERSLAAANGRSRLLSTQLDRVCTHAGWLVARGSWLEARGSHSVSQSVTR